MDGWLYDIVAPFIPFGKLNETQWKWVESILYFLSFGGVVAYQVILYRIHSYCVNNCFRTKITNMMPTTTTATVTVITMNDIARHKKFRKSGNNKRTKKWLRLFGVMKYVFCSEMERKIQSVSNFAWLFVVYLIFQYIDRLRWIYLSTLSMEIF